MTRINSAIPVKCLTDEHLLAEHREIKRLPYNLQKSIKSGSIKRIPNKFTLRRLNITDYLGNWFTNDIPDDCKKKRLYTTHSSVGTTAIQARVLLNVERIILY